MITKLKVTNPTTTEATCISDVSGKTNTKVLNVTLEQIQKWQDGELIQNAMPDLSKDDREFLISGITPEEWDRLFNDEEVLDDNNGLEPAF